FQTSPRMAGQLMGQSEFKDLKPFEGIKLEEREGQIRATAWLKNVPWLCVVKIDQDDIFEALQRVRRIGIYVFVLGAILIVLTVLLTTNQLVSILETKRRNIRFLDQQLRRTSYMASSMELSYGFFREVKDNLANIDVRFISPGEPVIMEVNTNKILDDLLEFLSSELYFKNIRVKRDYEDHLPGIRSDHSKLRQVFQNLVLNAVSAVEKDGEISLTTRAGQNGITVTIADDGPGIPEEKIEKIFDPLFTTKPEGTGLGLSICLNILHKLGGNISVKSEPGKGASFVIELPFQFKPSDK
ncbi:MAG: hypothetical protein JRJ50_15275, partial [Deltaproteobacteria bacterium]|nr:hypothetical protein [Deltaproteobacteria bacterium]